tara:strand:+ start:1841 stop:2290 length:450 start_codon:yes stop_codon:yes gene_type:complete
MRFIFILIFILFSCDDLTLSNKDNDDEQDSSNLVEEYFSYNVSNQVAFYFFNNVIINGELIDTTDWVAAFKNDICVGSQKWNCSSNSCEIPIYGEYSLNQDTQGYMLSGEFPLFKIYDSSSNIYYDAISSSQIPWQDGIFPIIDSLVVQ